MSLDVLMKEFDESKHPRGEHGRFGHGEGVSPELRDWARQQLKDQEPATSQQKTRTRRIIDGAKKAWNSAKPVLGQIAVGLAIGAGTALVLGVADYGISSLINSALNEAMKASHAKAKAKADEYERSRYEDPEQTRVRLEHGIKASHIMALYLRGGTLGEKDAAHAALMRMGIDPVKYAKILLKASATEMKAAFAALDHLITEDEANAILDALIKNLSADDAKKILGNVDQFGPDLKKVFDMDSLVGKWSSLATRPDAILSSRVDAFDLTKRWSSIVSKMNPYHGEHGRFASGPGGGASAYGDLSNKPWKDMTFNEKTDRQTELWEEWSRQSKSSDETTRAQATARLERLNSILIDPNHTTAENRDRALQSTGSVHDSIINARQRGTGAPFTPQGQPGRGAGDILGAAQEAQRRREQEAQELQTLRRLRDQLGGTQNLNPEEARASLEEISRVRSQAQESAFRGELGDRSSSESAGLLGSTGSVLSRVAQMAYVARSLTGSLISAGDSWSKGDYVALGRAATYMRADLGSLRGHMSELSGEGSQLASEIISNSKKVISAAQRWYNASSSKKG